MGFTIEERWPSILDRFVKKCKADRLRVEIVTRNGFHMYGYITEADDRALLVKVAGVDRLVMMSTVSTIIPRPREEKAEPETADHVE